MLSVQNQASKAKQETVAVLCIDDVDFDGLDIQSDDDEAPGAPEEFTAEDDEDFVEVRLPPTDGLPIPNPPALRTPMNASRSTSAPKAPFKKRRHAGSVTEGPPVPGHTTSHTSPTHSGLSRAESTPKSQPFPKRQKHRASSVGDRDLTDPPSSPATNKTPVEKGVFRRQQRSKAKNVAKLRRIKETRPKGVLDYRLTHHQQKSFCRPGHVEGNFDSELEFRVNKGAFEGYVPRSQLKNQPTTLPKTKTETECTLEYCLKSGYTYVPWDGQ